MLLIGNSVQDKNKVACSSRSLLCVRLIAAVVVVVRPLSTVLFVGKCGAVSPCWGIIEGDTSLLLVYYKRLRFVVPMLTPGYEWLHHFGGCVILYLITVDMAV